MANETVKKIADEIDIDELREVEFLEYDEVMYEGEKHILPYNWDMYYH